jgi:hypothetical protein
VPSLRFRALGPPLQRRRGAPDGTFSRTWFARISTLLAPKRPMPTPESRGVSAVAGQARLLCCTVLPSTSNSPAGPGASAMNIIPTQLSWALLAMICPCRELRTKMPEALS